jgi:hypothetical protein
MDIIEAAKASLRKPEDFAYFGDLHEDDGWGRAFGVHRDSDALERSNWKVITEDMQERFPDDFTTESASHWAVGWVETGRVKVLKDPALGIVEGNFTPAFEAVMEWKDNLDSYPVADEADYSALEWEEFTEYVTDEVGYLWRRREVDHDMPEILPARVLELVSQDHSSADDLSYDRLQSDFRLALGGLAA